MPSRSSAVWFCAGPVVLAGAAADAFPGGGARGFLVEGAEGGDCLPRDLEMDRRTFLNMGEVGIGGLLDTHRLEVAATPLQLIVCKHARPLVGEGDFT